MIKKTAALLFCALFLIILLTACGDENNSEITGEWIPTTATLDGTTVQYSSLGIDDDQFFFTFSADGKCTASLAGIVGEGTYIFNDTSVDIEINNEVQKLTYENGTLTLTLDYENNPMSLTFTKVR